ncbi:hypothetical protein [Candidatus Epulonipiscium viviparus]|uniref:hypothetical protein n=1 Tax=Candidatus Epulonipiscium viviparus TaxID=420336 RepID=UPI0027380F39|nr:hypothetical protein [Candidatus Epulopiscium viviparus]
MSKRIKRGVYLLMATFMASQISVATLATPTVISATETNAYAKIEILKTLIDQAREMDLDVLREETVVWMAYEFLKFADYDEANPEEVEMLFSKFMGYNNKKNIQNGEDAAYWSKNIAEFERAEVVEMLDKAIETLEEVIAGTIVRKAVRPVDWDNISVDRENGNFLNPDGKPIFLYDYFSKAQQEPRSDPYLYNDHIGNVSAPKALSLTRYSSTLDLSPALAGKMTVEENLNALKNRGTPLFNSVYVNETLNSATFYPRKNGATIDPILYTDHDGKPLLYNDMTDNAGFMMLWHSGGAVYPDWLIDKNNNPANSLITKAEGTAGIPKYVGYDIDQPAVQEAWKVLLEDVAEKMQGHASNRLGYILTNEPHWYTDIQIGKFFMVSGISDATLNKFRDYLRREYDDDINKLKDAWAGADNSITQVWGGTAAVENKKGDKTKLVNLADIKSFDDIEFGIPFDGTLIQGTVQHYDWCTFNMERVSDWFSLLNDAILSKDATAGTHIKLFPRIFTDAAGSRDHGMDLEALSRMTTYLGNDATIRKEYVPSMQHQEKDDWQNDYAYYWREVGLIYDLTNSFSPTHKVNVNSEGHAITINTTRDIHMDPEYVRSAYFLSAILGEDANFTWFWPRKGDGSPEATMISDPGRRDTYPGSVINMPQVANEITQTFLDLNAHSVEIAKIQNLDRPLRIFYSETSNIYSSNQINHVYDMYESVNFNGIPIGFATKNIMNDTLADSYPQPFDLTVIYQTPYVTDAEYEAILAFAKAENTVIVDDISLKYNQLGEVRDLAELYAIPSVIRENGIAAMGEAALDVIAAAGNLPAVTFSEGLPKGLIWRVAPAENGDYTVAIVNVSKHTLTFDVTVEDQESFNVVDLLTGQELGKTLTLSPEAVYLLNVGQMAPLVK